VKIDEALGLPKGVGVLHEGLEDYSGLPIVQVVQLEHLRIRTKVIWLLIKKPIN
jgi:hypothetical protein